MAEAKSPGKGRGGDRGSLPGRKGDEDDDDDEEEDARIIHAGSPVAPTASGSTSAAAQKREKIAAAHGLALDLGSKGTVDSLSEDRISTQLESAVTVVFELPDGSTWEEEFKLGHTVEMLKGYAEREFGIPMSEQQVYYDGSLMLDPMSLADYVGDSTTRVLEVRVEGEMEDDAKK